jgi:hypothetical protein
MRQDGREVGERGQRDEGPGKGVERRLDDHVNAAEERGYNYTRTIGLNGFRCFLSMRAKKLLNGVALARARV